MGYVKTNPDGSRKLTWSTFTEDLAYTKECAYMEAYYIYLQEGLVIDYDDEGYPRRTLRGPRWLAPILYGLYVGMYYVITSWQWTGGRVMCAVFGHRNKCEEWGTAETGPMGAWHCKCCPARGNW